MQEFVCERCGTRSEGIHCKECLWSKHVDVNPGDRSAVCKGLMEPIGIKGDEIVYRCHVCEKTVKNKIAPEDDKAAIAAMSGSA